MSVTLCNGDNPFYPNLPPFFRHSLPHFTTTYGCVGTVMTLFPFCRGLQDYIIYYMYFPANYVFNSTVSGGTRSVLETNPLLPLDVLG